MAQTGINLSNNSTRQEITNRSSTSNKSLERLLQLTLIPNNTTFFLIIRIFTSTITLYAFRSDNALERFFGATYASIVFTTTLDLVLNLSSCLKVAAIYRIYPRSDDFLAWRDFRQR